jgi:energy-coupling factor transporter ATP-binding protein EcfA2
MENLTHIKTVEIKGLWGKYLLEWDLNPDVNILAGINGSGKSTVLNLIAGVLQNGHFIGEVDQLVNEIRIIFNSTQAIHFSWNQDIDLFKEKSKAYKKEILQMLFSDFQTAGAENPSLFKLGLIKKEGFKEQQETNNSSLRVMRINTFDEPTQTQTSTQEYSPIPEKVKTDLDHKLFELQIAYLSYQIELGKQVEQAFLESDNFDIKTKREES